MRTNCYWLIKVLSGETIIVDPGDEGAEIAQMIYERQLKPQLIVATHGHRDHTGGITELKLIFGIKAYVENLKSDTLARWGMEVIPLPGHTRGSVGIYVPSQGWLLSGDSVLPEAEDEGRHGDLEAIKRLPEDTLVLPGHGDEFFLTTYWDRQVLRVT